MSRDRSRFAVVYATDENYLPLVCFSIHSICATNRVVPDVFVLGLGIGNHAIQKAEEYLFSLGARATFFSIPKSSFVLGSAKKLNPPVLYLNIKLGSFIPDSYERVLSLDADTRVVHDLTPLFEMDLQQATVGAANDIVSFSDEPYRVLKEKHGLSDNQDYFNAGVMLIDLQRWNERNIGERTLEYARRFPNQCQFRDQCALNKQLIDDWIPIDPRWNYYTPHFPIERRAFIYHFPKHSPWRKIKGRKSTVSESLILHHLWYREVAKKSPWPKAVVRCPVLFPMWSIYLRNNLAEFFPSIQRWAPSLAPSQKRWNAENLEIFDHYVRANDPSILQPRK